MIATASGLHLELSALSPELGAELLAAWGGGAEGFEREGDQLSLDHAALWALSDAQLHALGQRRYDRRLVLTESSNKPTGDRYHWTLSWGGQSAKPDGAWLLGWRGERWLLPPAMAEVARLAPRVAEHSAARRLGQVLVAVARLQRLGAACPAIALPERLLQRTIEEATVLRIEVDGGEDDPKPRALVMVRPMERPEDTAPATAAPAEVAPEEAGPADAPEPWGLPEAPSPLGAPRAVPTAGLVQQVGQLLEESVYHVDTDDTYLLLSAALARNVAVAEAAQREPDPALRRAFVQSPLDFLPEADAFDEAHYSARVIGLREAPRASGRPPQEARTWAEPVDGLLIELADGPLWVAGPELPDLARDLREAAARGQAALPFAGRRLPTLPALIDALERAARPPSAPREGQAPGPRPLILAIKENELQIEWAPGAAPRPAPAAQAALLRPEVALKQHQRVALAHLRQLWVRGERGGLLCDDMGLGKTLQGAVFAAWVCAQLAAGGGPALRPSGRLPLMLVAPPSLLRTWFTELEARLDPSALRRIVWAGDGAPRSEHGRVLRSLDALRADRAPTDANKTVLQHARLDMAAWDNFAPDALFVGYDTLRTLQHALGALDIGLLVADEAQAVKNPGSLRSVALRAMRYDFALGLTGTPIENSWLDLWSICDFALPGQLGTRADFVREYPQRGEVAEVGARLQRRLAGHLIRRTRAATLGDDLPTCAVHADRRPMPSDQATAYRAELAAAGRAEGREVLQLLAGLARVSLHPSPRAELHSADEARSWMRASARTAAALEVLDRWSQEGEAALIFLRSLAVQATLARALCLLYGLPEVPILNGALSFAAREATVRRVREGAGFRLLLVSPEVGGAGWNLQFAARSLLLERPYNPALEAQMIARTWRLGQPRPVEVHAPVATLAGITSYDEVLDGLLAEKRGLADSVLAPAQIEAAELNLRFGRLLREA